MTNDCMVLMAWYDYQLAMLGKYPVVTPSELTAIEDALVQEVREGYGD